MKINNNLLKGISGEAFLLTFAKVVTMALGIIVTRLLSENLSLHSYGTYSQILLIISTVSSLTILGMMDGVNFFYSGEVDDKRESYIATLFSFQCIIGAVTGSFIMLSGSLICQYFDNPDIKNLLIYAAVLPVLQNLLGMSQVLFVSIGKARLLAVRNLAVSVVRLLVAFVIIIKFNDIVLILISNLVLDLVQIIFFWSILVKNGCKFKISSVDVSLTKKIFRYCVPMAVFISVNALNRDIDKYLISIMTDTEILAVYSNASKQLPFDIIMASFCTVLLPKLTRLISEKKYENTVNLYKQFLEITYVSTGILCAAAISAAPYLMRLLYSEKYESGLAVFIVYILVDLFRFTNITLILSAAGKTKLLMLIGIGSLAFNAVANVLFYNLFGITGPAIATLLTTVLTGLLMLKLNSKALNAKLKDFFSPKYMAMFFCESIVLTLFLRAVSSQLEKLNWHYFIILVVTAGAYGAVMLLLNGKRFLKNIKQLNSLSIQVESQGEN